MAQEELRRVVGLAVRVALVVGAAGSVANAQVPSFTLIEPAPTFLGTVASGGLARTGVGLAGSSLETGRGLGMRWSSAAGREDIAGIGQGWAISANGNTIVVDGGQLWSPSTGIQSTGPGPGGRSFDPQGGRPSVGDNGSWIITTFRGSGSSVVPFRWTPTTGWRNLPGSYSLNTNIFDATPDGQAWVGETANFEGGSRFVYRNNVQETLSFQPRAMSDDASVLVGYRLIGNDVHYQAVLLTPSGETVLPSLPGFGSGAIATDVSNDGRTVVGRVFTSDGLRADAFIWREGIGMQLLRDYLSSFALVMPTSIDVNDLRCDASGTVISGTNTTGEFGGVRGFVAVVPSPGVIIVAGAVGCAVGVRRKRK